MSGGNASSLVNAGANAAQGNFVAAAVSIAKSIFGGSGKTPSVLQGFDVQGTFGASGFSGSVTAYDQKGNRWAATGETAYLQSLGAAPFIAHLSEPARRSFFDLGISTPVYVNVPTPDNTLIPAAVEASITSDLSEFIMDAPVVNAPAPAGQPAAAGAGASPAAVADTWAGMEQIVTLIALAGLLFLVLKGGKG